MKYEEYALGDFLLDDDFIRWVKNPDAHSDLFWEIWIAQHPEKKPVVEEARFIISSIQFEVDRLSVREVTEIWQHLHAERKISHHSHPEKRKVFPWQKMAAILGGLIFLAAFYFLIAETGINSMQQHSTAYGQTKTILLPDGSEVILNANSELKHADSWSSDSARQVWLQGEAFFSVRHQENDQKFIVHSGNIAIEVLGTEFNVNHRRTKTQVVLSTGKVRLQNNDRHTPEEVIMNPGELVEIEKDRNGHIKKVVDTEVFTSWKENKLVFDGTPIAEIAQLLEDNYGYKVIIQDSVLAGKQFKGMVPANEIDNLLGQIAKVFNVDIDRKDKQITMKLKSKNP